MEPVGIGVLRKSLETDWNKENGENSPCGGIVCHLDIDVGDEHG